MKKFYVLLIAGLWLLSNPLLAVAPGDTLRNKLNAVFSPIDKSQIPTGFLAEYGLPFIPLDLFNNTLTDSARTNMQAYRYAYTTFYTSRIYGSNFLPVFDTVNARIAAAEQTYATAIPIVLLRADYSTLRPDAVSANLLRVQNNQFYDVASRTQSPYTAKTAFLAAPFRSYSQSGSVSLIIPQRCYFQNNSKAVSNLYVDFADGGGYQAISWNQVLTHNYATKGTKRIKVKIRYADTQVLESHFDLEVLNPYCATCRYTIPSQPEPNVGAMVPGVHSGGHVYISLANNHTQLTKPLIVVEGYDASRIAPALFDNISISTLIPEIRNIRWPDNTTFEDNLSNNGTNSTYDIVYIDYINGTDDIRSNAALFRDVVAWVNMTKVGGVNGAPNTVLGISMGGLVARYGLAQMVKNGLNPQTNLLITHDSRIREPIRPWAPRPLPGSLLFPCSPQSRLPGCLPPLTRPTNCSMRWLPSKCSFCGQPMPRAV